MLPLTATDANTPDAAVPDAGTTEPDADNAADAGIDSAVDAGRPDAAFGPATQVRMELDSSELYAAPFPSEHLRDSSGAIDLSRAPNRSRVPIVAQIHVALEGIDGFGISSSIHFQLDGRHDGSPLPDAFTSTGDSSPIWLLDVDPSSPEHGTRRPFDTYFAADGGFYGAPNFVTLVPVQGIPLRPLTRYAVVIRSSLSAGLSRSAAMQQLLDGAAPAGLTGEALATYRAAIADLQSLGVRLDDVVAMSAFVTGDPIGVMERAVARTEGLYEPVIAVPFALGDVFDDYCVFEARARMPVFQEGTPPYTSTGGAWVLGPDGTPVLQDEQESRIQITIPRAPMPASGFPALVLIRTGAGGDLPLVQRGVRDAMGNVAIPGSGPALHLSRIGFAGVSFDGPHGGPRNVSNGDEQFLVFNIQNPTALRDNLRQSALETVMMARVLERWTIDASGCPDVTTPAGDGIVRFDHGHLALMGHSMGASIAPLAAAFEPAYRALILSGAGGSWLENVLYKEQPLNVRPLAQTLLGYAAYPLGPGDPALSLLQWAGESADAQVYARYLVAEPRVGEARHILMFQGIVDHYIMPPIANALTLALEIDRAGPALDVGVPEIASLRLLDDVLPLRGRTGLPFPVEGNVTFSGGAVTAAVSQILEDGVEDGHEVMWQTQAAMTQYRCFLRTFARDQTPRITDPAAADPVCD